MRIALVLKQGPEYTPEHVESLANQILAVNPEAEIVCLTDCELNHPAVKEIPLVNGWSGWWSKLELFRPGLLEGPTLYLDLDSFIVDRLDIDIRGFTMLSDVYRPVWPGSGVMAWIEPPSYLYEKFSEDPRGFMWEYRTRGKLGDQGFIRDHIREEPLRFGDEFRSFKVHAQEEIPEGCQVVYFHGRPRPWEVDLFSWLTRVRKNERRDRG